VQSQDVLRFSILVGLKDEPSHGYKLIKWLIEMEAIEPSTPTTNKGYIYLAMRKMQDDKLVASTWNKPTKGPAPKEYAITVLGEQWLKEQADSFGKKILALSNIYNVYNTP
jgi:DNA-binding PadR family transcriptional regulator